MMQRITFSAPHHCWSLHVPEVRLYFNFKLFRGNRATKTNAVGFNAFSSPNHPPLATV
ncbi:hypothetical protein BDZ91DRAFT_737659 [Kalaharituber pfeilii]|nr:hypothetical protein BDZ91DRAFT_737659 [Kalaharituber pfeilii]